MPTQTDQILVKGKRVQIVTLKDTEVHPEVMYSYLCRGSTHARMALTKDTTKSMDRLIRKKLVKDVFKE